MTTLFFLAMLKPSWWGHSAVPARLPPPWHHTSTGRSIPSVRSGVQMFRARQSSLMGPLPISMFPVTIFWLEVFHLELATSGTSIRGVSVCQHFRAYSLASTTTSLTSGFSGGMKRRGPTGGLAYRTPRKRYTPSKYTPRILP